MYVCMYVCVTLTVRLGSYVVPHEWLPPVRFFLFALYSTFWVVI